ncbi:MAG: DUF945 family protein, partial [Burkholderiales bacterium]|nr:DUF945 family protein [Burkholderiales bacterium]
TNDMPSLEIKNDSGHVRMTGISAEGNYQRDEDELWLGDSVMRMNNLAFRDESNPARPQQLALERVSLNTNQT